MSKEKKNMMVPKLRFPAFKDDDAWEQKNFGDAARFINGRAYKQEELLSEGKYRVLRVGNFFTNNEWYYSDLELEEDKYCDNGDLLYAWSASFGPRIWRGEKVIYHYHIWKVIKNEGIDKTFLFLLLDYETERMKSRSANGFALLHITKGSIESWKCYFPKSEAEQQKIASCLSSLDDLITAHTQKLDALKAHKKGLMQQLFPAEGEKVPKLRFEEFNGSGEWEEKTFDQLFQIGNGRDYKHLSTGNIPVYGSGGYMLSVDEYLYDGESACIGRKGTIDKPIFLAGKFWTVDTLFYTHSFVDCIPKYIFYIFQNTNWRKYNEAGGVPSLSKTTIGKIEVVVPKPDEQQKIADCLTSLDELMSVQEEKIEQLKMHKKGLMQGLFPQMSKQ